MTEALIYEKNQNFAHATLQNIALCTLKIVGTKLLFAYLIYAKIH